MFRVRSLVIRLATGVEGVVLRMLRRLFVVSFLLGGLVVAVNWQFADGVGFFLLLWILGTIGGFVLLVPFVAAFVTLLDREE